MVCAHFAVIAALSAVAVAQLNHTTTPKRSALPTVVDVLDERGWEDISYGLMLERDLSAEEARHVRRAHPETRDLVGAQMVDLHFNERGDMLMPASAAPHQRLQKRCNARGPAARVQYLSNSLAEEDLESDTPAKAHKKRKSHKSHKRGSRKAKKSAAGSDSVSAHHKTRVEKASSSSSAADSQETKEAKDSLLGSAIKTVGDVFAARITWYTGHDLLNPSCADHSKWNPTDKSMIAAVTIQWAGKPACGQYLRLRPKNGKKAIVVRVVDSCGGCASGSAHVDLTTTAFSLLYNLDVGLVNGVQVQKIEDPVQDYDEHAIATYGPKDL